MKFKEGHDDYEGADDVGTYAGQDVTRWTLAQILQILRPKHI